MKIGLLSRIDRRDALDLAKSILKILTDNGHEVDSWTTNPSHDMEIVIGGDGTILRAVNDMKNRQTPILGINMGGVGFLADIEPEEAIAYIKTIKTPITFEKRIRINVRNGEEIIGTALNEIAILHNKVGKMIDFTIIIDDVEVQTFKADGLIVSTPTGSTAYAMSAGGSIVDPLIHDGYLVVPVAPYLLSSRPQLISTKRKLEIDIVSEYAFIVVDGHKPVRVDTRYRIEIQVDPNPAKFVFVNRNFFKKVGDKLRRM
jgi:NAD+ kinase